MGGDIRAGTIDDPAMREFRPPVRPSAVRVAFAVILPVVVIVPMVAVLALVLGMTPASYTIGEGSLVVKSGDLFAGDRSIRLADVTETSIVPLSHGRRTGGTALPGFCAGRWSYPDLGTVWQVTTCARRGVLLRATGQDHPIVISPPDLADFADKLRTGTPAVVTLPPPDKGPLHILLMVVAPLAIVTAIVVPMLLLLGPKKMRYLVGDGALEVHTIFGKKRWPTAGARAREHTPARLIRVAGSGAPGYYTGIFRESGETTRVYATALDRVVLFEGSQRVLLSPEDRAGLLRALADEGVNVEGQA